ncbi:uncharacterized protein YycO [Bacilli bacterium PM5-9]|nr:uncharacterized protein YycO [Bacilli bacterium PM5-9]
MKIKVLMFCLVGLICINNIQAKTDYTKQIINKFNFKKIKKSSKKDYPTKKGTILVTPDNFKRILPVGHAAIIINKNYVYEATSKGVIRGANNWHLTKKRTFGLRVKNLGVKAHNNAVNYIAKQKNKKYNYNFFNTKTRKKFYCSHLVWSSFYDNFKINIDTKLFGLAGKKQGAIHPLELVLSNRTKTIFYYENK